MALTRRVASRLDPAPPVIELDVTDEASVAEAIGKSADALGGLDILVNNAGIVVAKPALDLTVTDWDMTIATNQIGRAHV